MSLESVSIALLGATFIIAYNGWQMVTSENDLVNQIGSFLVLLSINMGMGLAYLAFIIAENVPYSFLTGSLLPIINVTMWATVIVTVGYFLRVAFNMITLIKTVLMGENTRETNKERHGES